MTIRLAERGPDKGAQRHKGGVILGPVEVLAAEEGGERRGIDRAGVWRVRSLPAVGRRADAQLAEVLSELLVRTAWSRGPRYHASG